MNEKISNEEINIIETNEIPKEANQEVSKKTSEATLDLEKVESALNFNNSKNTFNLETSEITQISEVGTALNCENSEVETNSEDSASTENVQSSEENSFECVPNCLSLTVKEDYKLSIVKNVFFKSIRSGLKIAFSVLTLNLLKLFL